MIPKITMVTYTLVSTYIIAIVYNIGINIIDNIISAYF